MTRHRRTRHPRFVDLPRNKRGDAVIALKNDMRRHKDQYGGRFSSHLILDEDTRPIQYRQSFDFAFPGSDKFTLWNADIVTASLELWDRVSSIAYDRADAALRAEGISHESNISFEPASWSSTGKVTSYVMVREEEPRYDIFDGRTFREQWEHLEREIVRNEPPEIHESFKIDRQYAYGIGVKMVVDAEGIDRQVIEAAIDSFFAHGEGDWESEMPVDRERLPKVSQEEALKAGETGLPSNPVRM